MLSRNPQSSSIQITVVIEKWDKDHFQTVNDTYGDFYNNTNSVGNKKDSKFTNKAECNDLDAAVPEYLKESERMTGKKPYTPWSTSNAEYGKQVETGKPAYVNYKTNPRLSNPSDDATTSKAIETQRTNDQKVDAGQYLFKHALQSVTPKQGTATENENKLVGNNTANDSLEKLMPKNNEGGVQGDVSAGPVGYATASRPVPAVRQGLPSRGPARCFMQEQCGRLLDNIQALRGVKDTYQGRVQVLTLDDSAQEEQQDLSEKLPTKKDCDETEVAHSVPSSASSRSQHE